MASNSGGGGGGAGGSSGGSSSLGGGGMGGSNIGLITNKEREYDMKNQLEVELNTVRMQYIDSERRCDSTQEKLDYYIQQYTSTMGQLEMALQDRTR